MISGGRYPSEEMELKQTHAKIRMWIIIIMIVFGLTCPPVFTMAAPVVIDEDSYGFWENSFEDPRGIETWDNLELNSDGIRLTDTFYENFTGPTGSYPDERKWDVIHQGGTLEINNNRMRSSDAPPYGTWHEMMVQTKSDFRLPHTLTWRQQLQTLGAGMYYHFRILNALNGSTLLGISQNYLGSYGVYNYYVPGSTSIGSWVSGWHDYKVTFDSGLIEIYMDNVKKFTYDYFDVESVRYVIGMDILHPASATLYTDDILISSNTTSGNLTSTMIELPAGQTWESLEIGKSEPDIDHTIEISVLDGITYLPIPGFENLTGINIDLSSIDYSTYPAIRLKAHFSGNGNNTPVFYGWKVTWRDTLPPTTPTGLTVTDPLTGNKLIINWDSNSEPDVATYVLYFSTDNLTFYWLANTTDETFSFNHSDLATGVEYYYTIAAADEVPNQSPFSEVVSAIPDTDLDGDGIGDSIDDDLDGDTVPNALDEYPLNENEWADSDGDSIADNADSDDDNDGYDDTIDEFPFNDTEWLDTDYDGIGNNADPDDDNDGIPDISDPYPYSDANEIGIKIDELTQNLSGVNESIFDRITDAETNIIIRLDGLNMTAILDYILGMNDTLSSEIQDILNSITYDIIEMNSSLSGQLLSLTDNMLTEHDVLQQWLDIVIDELGKNVTTTNATLHKQINDLDTSMTSFYNNLVNNIGDIQSDLQSHDQNTGQDHSDIIDLINDLLTGQVEKERITELRRMLTSVAGNLSEHNQSIADDIMEVVNNIDEFESETEIQLDGINQTLAQLAKLEGILGELEAFDNSLDQAEEDIQDSIDERSTKEEDKGQFIVTELLLIVVLILVIVNLLLILMKRGQRGTRVAESSPTEKPVEEEVKKVPPPPPKQRNDINIGGSNNMTSLALVLLIFSGLLCIPYFTFPTNAVPVIHEEDSNGSWEDTFNDTTGVDIWDNIESRGYGIRLVDMFFENFTGLYGDPPDALKWDIFDDGYVLWRGSNNLRTEADPPSSSWKVEMIQTNDSFSRNHTLTWKQSLQTITSGMYYHFYVFNASDGSWLLNLYQNSAGQYMVWNNATSSGVQLGTSVTGWHDFKVIFTDGFIEFYYDGVKEHEYDFGVESVKYRFGTFVQTGWTRSGVDEVFISSNITSGNLTSTEIVLPGGYTWDTLEINKTIIGDETFLNVTVLDGMTYLPILGFENLSGTNIDISGIDPAIYPTIRLKAHLVGDRVYSPFLHDWKVIWSDTVPPGKPTGLTASDMLTGYSLFLDWNPNPEEDVVTYIIYFSTDNITFSWLCNLPSSSQSFIHYGLTTGTTYYYKIAAADEIPNQSPFSDVAEGVPDIDTDGDGIGNIIDDDDDGDTAPDIDDDFPLNPNENIDTDGDGIGNHADFDDDNDGYIDENDEFPLIDTEWLDTDNDGTGNNADLDDDNDGIPDIADLYPYSNINDYEVRIEDLIIQLSDVNTSLQTRISDAETNILNKIDDLEILSYLEGLNATLYAELQNLLTSITNDVIGLNSSLSEQLMDLLNNMTTDHNALEQWLDIVLNELDANLTATNNTLHQQLDELDASMTTFYIDLINDIGDIQSDLLLHDQNTGENHSDSIGLLNDLLDGQIEKDKIAELRTMLVNLAENLSEHDQSIADDIRDVVEDIDQFEVQTDDQLQRINQTLEQLEKLEDILGDLEVLDSSLDQTEEDIQDSIDETSTKEEDEGRFFVIELLLIIVLIFLVINLITTLMTSKQKPQGGGGDEGNPAEESIQEERIAEVEDRKIPPRPPSIQSKP